MTSIEQQLQEFESNVETLLSAYSALKTEREELFETINRQRLEIIQTHAELANLQQEHRKLQTAYALTADSEKRTQAKRQITKLIGLIDKSIEQLASTT